MPLGKSVLDSFGKIDKHSVSALRALGLGAAIAMGTCGVTGILGFIGGAKVGGTGGGSTVDLVQSTKECVLDVFVGQWAQNMLIQVFEDYSNYALGGFEGKHPFFANKERYLHDLIDDATGKVIDRNGLGFLCDTSGFNIDISQHLRLRYRRITSRPPRCTGTQAFENVQKLL